MFRLGSKVDFSCSGWAGSKVDFSCSGWAGSKVDFCQRLILPKTVMAAKYIMLYRKTFIKYLSKN